MKLSKKAWIFLAVGIFVIAVASLNMAATQQGQEQSRLDEELSLAQQRLKKLASQQPSIQPEELESQLAQVEAQLKTAKASLAQSIQSIEVTDTLFEVAETYGVEIIDIESPGVTSLTLEGLTCSALTLIVTAEGDVDNLINFVLELSEEFPTGVVESVEINVPEVSEETEEEVETVKPSANLKLCIYTYEGD